MKTLALCHQLQSDITGYHTASLNKQNLRYSLAMKFCYNLHTFCGRSQTREVYLDKWKVVSFLEELGIVWFLVCWYVFYHLGVSISTVFRVGHLLSVMISLCTYHSSRFVVLQVIF